MRDKEVKIKRVRRKGFAKNSESAHSRLMLRCENSQEIYFYPFYKSSRELGLFKCIHSVQAVFLHQKQKKKKP